MLDQSPQPGLLQPDPALPSHPHMLSPVLPLNTPLPAPTAVLLAKPRTATVRATLEPFAMQHQYQNYSQEQIYSLSPPLTHSLSFSQGLRL